MQALRFAADDPMTRGRREDPPTSPILHGGNLDAARRRFPNAPTPWIDLSTGVNPRSYPVGAIHRDTWRRLPDPAALARLTETAATTFEVGPRHEVVAAPGTQALIQILPRLMPARRVAVLGFGYQEHPAAWRAAGAAVAVVETVEALRDADVAVVVNPNNPDGRIVDPARLADLARHLGARGGTLVVDEAFVDVCDASSSLVPLLPESGAVVLRSFGKFYGLAGLRLGFAVAGARCAARLRAALGPWAVSGPALAIATRALADAAWRRAEIERLRADAARLDGLLGQSGFEVLGGTCLFRLVGSAEAERWFVRLGEAGILVRPFPDRPTWLRFGLPGGEDEWRRLAVACRP